MSPFGAVLKTRFGTAFSQVYRFGPCFASVPFSKGDSHCVSPIRFGPLCPDWGGCACRQVARKAAEAVRERGRETVCQTRCGMQHASSWKHVEVKCGDLLKWKVYSICLNFPLDLVSLVWLLLK